MSKYKITLVDCENYDNKITLLVNDEHMDMSDDIYAAVEKFDGMSKSQVAKVKKFAESCPGPFMVDGHYYNNNNCEEIDYKQFTYGHVQVCKGVKYMHIYNATRVQGHRNKAYRIPVGVYKGIDDIRDLIERMEFNGEHEAGSLEHIYSGENVR